MENENENQNENDNDNDNENENENENEKMIENDFALEMVVSDDRPCFGFMVVPDLAWD